MHGSPLTQLTDESFDEGIGGEGAVSVVEFWASWCMPCRMLEPVMRQLAQSFDAPVRVVQVDTDKNRESAKRFDVTAVPTVLLLREGKVVSRFVGLTGYEKLAAAIESALDADRTAPAAG